MMTMKIMKIKKTVLAFSLLALLFGQAAQEARAASDEAEVRALVERVFQQLRSGAYNELYDVLPSAQQGRIPRDRFVRSLSRASDACRSGSVARRPSPVGS